ncbi:hypothetical protein J22TS3_25170 [Paenibacillus sp. J22TS3]|nr:hypothetical protein J22TS3_25170 [Paenibacillus sp. J22TS3]
MYWAQLDLVQGQYEETVHKLQQIEEGIEEAKSIRNLNKPSLDNVV